MGKYRESLCDCEGEKGPGVGVSKILLEHPEDDFSVCEVGKLREGMNLGQIFNIFLLFTFPQLSGFPYCFQNILGMLPQCSCFPYCF